MEIDGFWFKPGQFLLAAPGVPHGDLLIGAEGATFMLLFGQRSGMVPTFADAEDQAALEAKSDHNSVRVELPRDDPPRDRYEVAAALLAEWRRDGTLVSDTAPTFTVYRMSYADEAGAARHTVGVRDCVRKRDSQHLCGSDDRDHSAHHGAKRGTSRQLHDRRDCSRGKRQRRQGCQRRLG